MECVMADGDVRAAAASDRPVLSVLIVSYNTRAETLACLASLARETPDLEHEVIVVDNASSDGSAEAIAAEFPNVRLIALSENAGFARGNNIAAEAARGDYLLLLNPDTIILDRAAERLVAFARATPGAGIWGSSTLFGDGRLDPTCAFRRMSLGSLFCRATGLANAFASRPLFNGELYPDWQRDSVREVDVIAGCYLLITHDLWRRLEGFDPLFFMYGEEADLCLRARALGAKPLFTPDAPITHFGGLSERTRTSKMIKLLTAKSTLVRRYFAWPAILPGLALLAFWPLSRWLTHGLVAALTGRDASREEAGTWAEIWRARSVWLAGFSLPTAAPRAASASAAMSGPHRAFQSVFDAQRARSS
jgi:hypothetical protein